MFQICPVCDMQQDIEPYDVCQVCGHEWSGEEIRSSTPAPIERPLTKRAIDVTTVAPCTYCLNNDGSHQSWCPRHPSRN